MLKAELEEDDSSFCNLVKNISQDTGSLSSCGSYFFGKGEMVPEFEEASFNLAIDKFTVVKTDFGYHLIQRLPISAETKLQVESDLLVLKSATAYSEFIKELKESAEIEILLELEEESEEDSGFEIIDIKVNDSQDMGEEEEVEEAETEEEMKTEEIEEIEETEDIEEEMETEEIEEILEPEVIFIKPKIDYYYSESDENSKEITQLITDLETQGFISVSWKCIRVNMDDKEICIELYSKDIYDSVMQEAKQLGLEFAPTIFIDEEEYAGEYSLTEIKSTICELAGC